MNLKEALYEAPDAEEIVFTSVDAIALSEGTDDGEVDDSFFDDVF